MRSKDDIDFLPKQIDIGVEVVDFGADLTNSTIPLVRIDSIEPAHGPTTGETRVLVRGGPFGKWALKYPSPYVSYSFLAAVLLSVRLVCAVQIWRSRWCRRESNLCDLYWGARLYL